jgi:glycosyltransferase involved in cell wall biosynthesis
MTGRPPLALVHDYLTQRGGAERVVLTLSDANPGATIHTSLYDPAGTFPEFSAHDVRTLPLDRIRILRDHHRLALPLLAPAFSRLHVDAEVTVCSSSGWAHGAQVTGAKVVYCHNPARWLYQADQYLAGSSRLAAAGLAVLSPPLRRWDRRAAATADRYLVNSRAVRARVADAYGIDADVVPPPVSIDVDGPRRAVEGIEPGFVLCVSRLLPYKNVGAVVEAAARRPDQRLVVVGTGPEAEALTTAAPANVTVLGRVADDELRWLYTACLGLVAASYEDFGLTPIEAAAFGRPTAALRWGGFLDTVVEGTTGLYFDEPTPDAIASALDHLTGTAWSEHELTVHAATFSPGRFLTSVAAVVDEVRGTAR